MDTEFYKFIMTIKEIYLLFLQEVYRNEEITSQQMMILKLIAHKGETQNNEIYKELKISKGTASGIIKRLFEKGLIEKIPLKRDKRNYKIILSEEGKKFCYKYKKEMEDIFKNIFKNFTEEEINEYTKILQEILNKMKV